MDFENVNHLFHYLNAYIIFFVVIGIIGLIFTNKMSPANAFLSGIILLLLSGVLELTDFLNSFSNPQVITIFALIFITTAIRRNTDFDRLFIRWFRRDDSESLFLIKLSGTVAILSSVLNNTPIVSLFTGNVQQWARKKNISPSRFLIPLSYSAILGGMITIIGTSTNLVLIGLMTSNGQESIPNVDFLVVGSVVCLVGLLLVIMAGPRLIPDRTGAYKEFANNVGEYVHEADMVNQDLVGKSVQDAGLKNLEGIYLIEISRKGEGITPVPPDTVIEASDQFYFAGDTELVVEFIRGHDSLKLPEEEKLKKVGQGNITEVVLSANSSLNGVLVKESDFRDRYNASIIGVHRNGERITGKIGSIRLKTGDLLLCLAGNDFHARVRADKNLYFLGEVSRAFKAPEIRGRWYYNVFQLMTIAGFLLGHIDFLMALLITLFLLVGFKLLPIDSIKRNFNFDLLVVLACSLALGKVFIDSGAADIVSDFFLNIVPRDNPILVMISLYLLTVLLTSMVTNIAAVVIVFPLAFALSNELGLNNPAFYLSIAFGASAAFLTPMGYQTNMMVYGPGGYKSIDFLRLGIPLLVVYSITSLGMICWYYGLI